MPKSSRIKQVEVLSPQSLEFLWFPCTSTLNRVKRWSKHDQQASLCASEMSKADPEPLKRAKNSFSGFKTAPTFAKSLCPHGALAGHRAGDGEEDHWNLIPITSPSLHPDSLTQESMCKCLLNPDFSFRQQLLGFVFVFFTKTRSSFKYLNCRSKSLMLPI